MHITQWWYNCETPAPDSDPTNEIFMVLDSNSKPSKKQLKSHRTGKEPSVLWQNLMVLWGIWNTQNWWFISFGVFIYPEPACSLILIFGNTQNQLLHWFWSFSPNTRNWWFFEKSKNPKPTTALHPLASRPNTYPFGMCTPNVRGLLEVLQVRGYNTSKQTSYIWCLYIPVLVSYCFFNNLSTGYYSEFFWGSHRLSTPISIYFWVVKEKIIKFG
jgi:hypothetical protein